MSLEIKPGVTQGMFEFDGNGAPMPTRSVEITIDGEPVIGRVAGFNKVIDLANRNLARINEIGSRGSGNVLRDFEEMSKLDREAWDLLHSLNSE